MGSKTLSKHLAKEILLLLRISSYKGLDNRDYLMQFHTLKKS